MSHRRRDPEAPKVRRCAYCGLGTTVTLPDARAATQLSRPIHSPIFGVEFPPICHETRTTCERSRALALEASR